MEHFVIMAAITCLYAAGIIVAGWYRQWLGILLMCLATIGIFFHLHFKLERENERIKQQYQQLVPR